MLVAKYFPKRRELKDAEYRELAKADHAVAKYFPKRRELKGVGRRGCAR